MDAYLTTVSWPVFPETHAFPETRAFSSETEDGAVDLLQLDFAPAADKMDAYSTTIELC